MTARRSRSYRGQPGSPSAAKRDPGGVHGVGELLGRLVAQRATQHLRRPRSRVSKTNGISSAWQAPSRPPKAGDGQANSYMNVPAGAGACASASRTAGTRTHQSVSTSASRSPGLPSGMGGAVGGQGRLGREPEGSQAPGAVDLHRTGQHLVGDLVDEAAEDGEHPPVVGVRAHEDVDAGGGTGGDPLDRARPGRRRRRRPGGTAWCSRPPRRPSAPGRETTAPRRPPAPAPRGTARSGPRRGRPGWPGRRGSRRTGRRSGRRRRGDDVVRRPALQDGAAEEPLGAGHGQQDADRHGPGGLAEDGDAVRVAAECGDVVPHPGERGDLVEQAQVGAVVAVAEIEEAVGPGAPVDGHADDAVAGEAAAVVAAAGGEVEGAAGAPDHHRQPGRARVGGPDVEVQAVIARDGRIEEQPGRVVPRELRLRRLGAESDGVAHAGPRLDRPRRPEAAGADRWRRVGDAQEGAHAVAGTATHLAGPGGDDGVHGVTSLIGGGVR